MWHLSRSRCRELHVPATGKTAPYSGILCRRTCHLSFIELVFSYKNHPPFVVSRSIVISLYSQVAIFSPLFTSTSMGGTAQADIGPTIFPRQFLSREHVMAMTLVAMFILALC